MVAKTVKFQVYLYQRLIRIILSQNYILNYLSRMNPSSAPKKQITIYACVFLSNIETSVMDLNYDNQKIIISTCRTLRQTSLVP